MASFDNLIKQMENWGFTDSLLPFMLIFTVIYAVLSKVNIFGKEKKNYNVVVALVISLSAVIPHVTGRYPPGADVIEILNKALPNLSLVVILVVMVFVLLGIFGAEADWVPNGVTGFVVLLAFGTVLYIFAHAAGWTPYIPSWLDHPETKALIIIILVFGLLIYWITRDSSDGKASLGASNIMDGISRLFKKN